MKIKGGCREPANSNNLRIDHLDGHIRLMSFYICKVVDGHVIWFTAIFPATKWGPQEQALAFRTRGHAQQALARLPKNASRGAKIIDGGTSSAI